MDNYSDLEFNTGLCSVTEDYSSTSASSTTPFLRQANVPFELQEVEGQWWNVPFELGSGNSQLEISTGNAPQNQIFDFWKVKVTSPTPNLKIEDGCSVKAVVI